MRSTADRVFDTGGIKLWEIDASKVSIQSELPLPPKHFEETLLPRLMQNALIQLGLELKFQAGVAIEPHKLFIFGLETGESYTHKFEQKPGTLIRDMPIYFKMYRTICFTIMLLSCYRCVWNVDASDSG